MKHLAICFALLFAACSFNPGGLPAEDVPDGGEDASADTDGGADAAPALDAAMSGTDAAPPSATIVCSTETIDGYPKIVLTFGGDVLSGFLGADPGSAPDSVEYGSNLEDLAVTNSCPGTWTIPYPSGCTKHAAVWGSAPKLYLEPEVDYLNVALYYADGTVRWGDLKTADGDDVGFTVSGLDCRIELIDGGQGGYIRTHP
ncbi:MAG TPA: hypothetical protein VJ694_03475 [Patescibacteria group bacterium]|nr:hypothetical protein [Patescibacteria group bacterium]